MSVLSAMYDWGKNRRNIEGLLSYLLNAGIDFETTTTDRKYEFGGPLEYEISRTRLGVHFRIIVPKYAGLGRTLR